MRVLVTSVAVLVLLGGCKALDGITGKKHDNPVLQPPPQRVTMDDSEVERRLADLENAPKPSGVQLASVSEALPDDTEIFNASVVAKVNGAPVFAGEVLEKYGEFLKTARTKMPPQNYYELRESIIQRDLVSHIQRRLLVERMRSSMKPDQIKQLEQHIDKAIDPEIEKLKKDLKVSSRTELEFALNDRSTTLSAVRDSFATNRMAMEYLASKIERPPAPTRPDLVEYYQAHLDDYKMSARVKWQHIQASSDGNATQREAKAKIVQAQQALQKGVAFEAVARQFSDGPTVAEGGFWDWTQRGSLVDSKLEDLLFTIPVGQFSDIVEGKSGFHLVRVLDRQDAGRKPFEAVQDEILQKLLEERQRDLPKNFVDEIYKSAVIETNYKLVEPKG